MCLCVCLFVAVALLGLWRYEGRPMGNTQAKVHISLGRGVGCRRQDIQLGIKA